MNSLRKRQVIGFFMGLAIAFGIMLIPIQGLDKNGKMSLALSMLAVCWWATKVMHSGFVSLALLLGFCLFLDREIVPMPLIFSAWTSPIMYLVIGGFLIAEAVQISGLGERLAFLYIKKFIKSYQGIIISCYLLGAFLSIMIPHPWPRSFLILSVMHCVIVAANIEEKYAKNICLAIFIGSVPTSMIFLTGDSTLNPIVVSLANEDVSWLKWFCYMGVLGLIATALLCTLQLKLFGQPDKFLFDKSQIEERLLRLGKLSKKEKICIMVLIVAIFCWVLDSVIGIHPAWVTVGAVVILALPFCGVLTDKSLGVINLGTLLFLSAALSIGSVGNATGMNDWITTALLPVAAPSNPYIFALITCGICMAIHMLLGSTLAVLGIVVPAIIVFGTSAGFPPIVSSMLAYIAVASHWILPFHHMNILVGCGENAGNLDEKNIIKMGILQTVTTVVISMLAITWWKIIKLI